MRTEGFKGAILSVLVIASMVTAALSISITSVSAVHTPTVSIDKNMVKAGAMVLTITVQNAGPDAIDNVWIVLPSSFSNFMPIKKVPKDNIVRTDVSTDNLIILQAGTFVQLATSEIVELAENTDVVRLKDTWIWVPAWGENAQLKENGLLEVRQDTNTGDNLAIGDNVGPVLDKQLTLTTDNRVRVVADTQVVWVSGNTVKLLENALVEVVVDDNASDYVSGDNVALEVEKTVTLQDNRLRTVNLVNVKRGGVTSTNIDAGVSIELLSSVDNNVVLPVDTKVKFLSDVTVTIPENTDVIRPANNRLELISPAENEPINWNQSVAASSTAPPGTYVEWTGIDENRIVSGASLAFPFAVTTPPAGGDYTIYVKTTDTTDTVVLKEITLTVDNLSPTVTIAASPSWVKDNQVITITVTASESLAKLENVMAAENNAPENTQIVMTPNSDNTVWTGPYMTGDNSKRDGTAKIYVIGAQFEDLVGNKGNGVFESTFTIDRLKPLKPNLAALTGFPTSPTNVGSWIIEGTAQDNFLGSTVNLENGTVKIRFGPDVVDVTANAVGYFYKTITLTEGTKELGIQYVDLAGNVGTENAENVTYDATAPSISIISPADGAIITDNTPLIKLTIADAVMGVENDNFSSVDNSGYLVYLRRDADNDVIAQLAPKAYPTSDPFKSFTFENQWPTELPDGWYNVFVIAGDNLQSDTAYFRFMVQASEAGIRTVIYPAADVYAFGGDGTGYSRSQLKFDIRSIPPESIILSAKLWLYRLAADNWNGEILLNRVDDQLWDENITAKEFDDQTLENEENQAGKFMSPGWDYLDVENQLNADYEAGHTYSSYRLRWSNDNGGEPSVGIDDGRFLAIESELNELSVIFFSSEYDGRDPYLEVVYFIPQKWNLIGTWTSTIEAFAEWRSMESREGSVSTPVKWALTETWTGTFSGPAEWKTVERWEGMVKTPPAPAEWQTVQIWKGTVKTPPAPPVPAEWKLIKIWTGALSTSVVAPPSKPSLISPPDGTITGDNTPTFDWFDVTGAENYDLLVDNNSDFSSPEIQVTVPVSTYTPTAELPDAKYWWKVRARDAAGNASEWSSTWSLTIRTIVRGVEVSISPKSKSGPPGETLTYTVTVKNTGAENDDYVLTVTDNENWNPTLLDNRLENVQPGENRTLALSVVIPPYAIENDSMTVTVTAKSMADPSVTGSDTCVTVVEGAPVVPGVDLALLAILAFPIGAAILLPAYLHRRRRRAARLWVLRAVALSLGAALLAMIYHLCRPRRSWNSPGGAQIRLGAPKRGNLDPRWFTFPADHYFTTSIGLLLASQYEAPRNMRRIKIAVNNPTISPSLTSRPPVDTW